MSARLDPRPLLRGVRRGLRHRAVGEHEDGDTLTRVVLILTPLVVAGAVLGFRLRLSQPDVFVGGLALLAGVLLGAFTLIANWRAQLSQRVASYDLVEGPARRALDEAVAHTLVAASLSVVGCVVAVVLGGVTTALPATILTACLAALGTYLLLTFLIIVNLLWDGYERANAIDEREAKKQRERNY